MVSLPRTALFESLGEETPTSLRVSPAPGFRTSAIGGGGPLGGGPEDGGGGFAAAERARARHPPSGPASWLAKRLRLPVKSIEQARASGRSWRRRVLRWST